MSSITERLDKIASELESENPTVALALDRISDRLENKTAVEKIQLTPEQIENLKKADKELLDHFSRLKIKEVWAEKLSEKKISVNFETEYAWVPIYTLGNLVTDSGNLAGLGISMISVDYDKKEDFEQALTKGKVE